MTINSDEIALNQTWKKADVITFIAFLCNELPCNCRFAALVFILLPRIFSCSVILLVSTPTVLAFVLVFDKNRILT